MKIRCEFNTCKNNSNNGKDYDKIKRKGLCCCQDDIELNAFCVCRVEKDDLDDGYPEGVYNEDEKIAEGLYCNKYEFGK